MIDAYISEHRDRFVADWQTCCRFPSVSGARAAIEDCADWIEGRMAPLFDDVWRIEIEGQGPLVCGEWTGTGPGRLLIYTHYDVQPAGDAALWASDPFGAEIRDGKMYARGACDDKADVTARLQALEAWRASLGGERPPFTIIFISDPAEEIGSPGLAEALAANADRLHADACLWESFLRDEDGRPGIGFGCRGNLEATLSLRLLKADQHTAFASILRSAPLELMRAVSTLQDETGHITVEGWTAGALQPTTSQLTAARAIPLPRAAVTRDDGTNPFKPGDDESLATNLVFEPSMSVSRFIVGADNVGSVPAEASITLRFSLVPDQDPEHCLSALRAHLAAVASDITVEAGRMILPASSPMETPFATATISAAAEVFGEPAIYPVLIGAGPGRMVLDTLGAPVISPAGTLRPDGNMHGPNEHGAITDYLDHIRFTTHLLTHLATLGGPTA
ncbi:M20/M25/M40 family metallo-hydrolase [Conexibacter woesei]|uniref:M20/M25/M40 family metallo-hydrolase n=1 Tax=Conexibacter woesei TaxID=191495 RepID=UPI0004234E23|nr:M20/M25/M40 family metallo-hydrolase [Conexibacter woesei]